jgi:hypothetical protein
MARTKGSAAAARLGRKGGLAKAQKDRDAQLLGYLGGIVKSEAKTLAARANAKRPRPNRRRRD